MGPLTCDERVQQPRQLSGQRLAQARPGVAQQPLRDQPELGGALLGRSPAARFGALHHQVLDAVPAHAPARVQDQLLEGLPAQTTQDVACSGTSTGMQHPLIITALAHLPRLVHADLTLTRQWVRARLGMLHPP